MATTSAPEPGGGRAPHAAAALSEDLYARHHRMVAGLCRALLRDPTDAEDAAQQAFLSAHRALLNGAEPREPAAWLATIARNECLGRIGARMREPLATDRADTVAGGVDPVAEALRRADLAALWRAIDALPRSQRDALLLREFGGLRYDELAVALVVTEPAVESLLVRARTRLRTQLKAAYASVSGGAWLDWLARLATGGAAPAAAAKAVALGLGAAAVTGGAVFAPGLVDRGDHRPRAPTRATTWATTPPRAHRAALAAPTIAAVLAPPRVERHRIVRRAAPVERRQAEDRPAEIETNATSGERAPEREQTTARGGEAENRPSATTTTTTTERSGEGENRGFTTTTSEAVAEPPTVEGEGGDGGEGAGTGSDG